MWVGGQRHAPAALPPGKTRYPLCRRLGGPQGRTGQVRKISPFTGIQSPDRPARSESLYRLRCPGPNVTPCRLVNSWPTFRKIMWPSSCAGSWRWRQVASPVLVCLEASTFPCLYLLLLWNRQLNKIMPVRSYTCQSGSLLLIVILGELTFQRNVDPKWGIIIVPPHLNEGPF